MKAICKLLCTSLLFLPCCERKSDGCSTPKVKFFEISIEDSGVNRSKSIVRYLYRDKSLYRIVQNFEITRYYVEITYELTTNLNLNLVIRNAREIVFDENFVAIDSVARRAAIWKAGKTLVLIDKGDYLAEIDNVDFGKEFKRLLLMEPALNQ